MYKVTPLVEGFRERTNLTVGEVFHLNHWLTYYGIDHEISYE